MTVTSPEPSRLSSRLHRFWPAYCFLAALVTFGYTLYDPYQIDGDAVAYMDIGDLIRQHQWAGVINGYWNPLYPALLALGHTVFHATRYTELHAYYLVNFGIFLLEMLAVVAFTDALIQLRDQRETTAEPSSASFLLDRYTLRYLGIGLLVLSAQRELSMGKIRPDALLQATLLFALAALLRYLATNHLRYAALMGISLGLAYLTKSFAFLFTFLCILALVSFRIIWQRSFPARAAAAGLLVLICFSIVACPYIAALSQQKGRFDFGDSGSLNYAWFISGTEKLHLQPGDLSQTGVAEVHLKHPERQLLHSPAIFSYKQLPYGTYPDWFDPSFWNDQIKAHMNPRLEIAVIPQCFLRLLRYLSNNPEPWLLLLLLFFLGARLLLGWRPSNNAFWLAPALLGAAVLCIYGMVHIEDRYIAVGVLTILLSLSAALRLALSVQTRTAASAVVFLLALIAVGESARSIGELRRNLVNAHSTAGWNNSDIFRAAQALNELGVKPGDTVACIGARACLNDHYWARLAGVRILTEIYEPATPLYPALATMPNRDQAIDVVRLEGAKVLVGYFDPGLMTGATPVSAGWRELDKTPFYALPLNLPPASSSTH
jgi:4-amino-4-deoxy-L-arabinose transferase-like glycosyltransferase